jgi:hypothetical protein
MPQEGRRICGRHFSHGATENTEKRSLLLFSVFSVTPRQNQYRNIHAPLQPKVPQEAHGYCGKAILSGTDYSNIPPLAMHNSALQRVIAEAGITGHRPIRAG